MGSVISSFAIPKNVISCRDVIRFKPDFVSCLSASCSESPFRSRIAAEGSMLFILSGIVIENFSAFLPYNNGKKSKCRCKKVQPAQQINSVPLFPVHFLRVKHLFPYYIALKRAVEARFEPGVACSALLLYEIEQAVLVAIGKDADYLLEVTALFALLPEFLPAPAVIVGISGFLCQTHGLIVCIGHHQYFAAL